MSQNELTTLSCWSKAAVYFKKDEFEPPNEDMEVDSSDSSDDETVGVETSIRPSRVGHLSAFMALEEQIEPTWQKKMKKEHDDKALKPWKNQCRKMKKSRMQGKSLIQNPPKMLKKYL